MNIEITDITVIEQKNSSDIVTLYTTLPGAVWSYDVPQHLTFDAAKGTGVGYCEANFPGIPVKVIVWP